MNKRKTQLKQVDQNTKPKTRLGIEILSISILLSIGISNLGFAQNVGINTQTPDNSAVLELYSEERGLLIPRMTTGQRDNIDSPAESVLIFNTTTQCYEGYNAITNNWVAFGCIGCSPTTANAGSDINLACGATTATLSGNNPSVGTGSWSVISGTASITTPSSPTSTVTGLAVPGTATLRWTISNPPCTSSTDDVVITTTSCPPSCGSQVWTYANINVGTMVDYAYPASQTNDAVVEKYCYNNTASNCDTYGGIYIWTEAMQIPYSYSTSDYPTDYNCDPCGSSGRQGICPTGYHIPTDLEWSRYEWCIENTIAPTGTTTLNTFQTTMSDYRGATTTAGPGSKMKVNICNTPAWDGTNASGFSALPAGIRLSPGFSNMGDGTFFLSATESTATSAYYRYIASSQNGSGRGTNNKVTGYSVRCLKN